MSEVLDHLADIFNRFSIFVRCGVLGRHRRTDLQVGAEVSVLTRRALLLLWLLSLLTTDASTSSSRREGSFLLVVLVHQYLFAQARSKRPELPKLQDTSAKRHWILPQSLDCLSNRWSCLYLLNQTTYGFNKIFCLVLLSLIFKTG
jgi:hypothetical protein